MEERQVTKPYSIPGAPISYARLISRNQYTLICAKNSDDMQNTLIEKNIEDLISYPEPRQVRSDLWHYWSCPYRAHVLFSVLIKALYREVISSYPKSPCTTYCDETKYVDMDARKNWVFNAHLILNKQTKIIDTETDEIIDSNHFITAVHRRICHSDYNLFQNIAQRYQTVFDFDYNYKFSRFNFDFLNLSSDGALKKNFIISSDEKDLFSKDIRALFAHFQYDYLLELQKLAPYKTQNFNLFFEDPTNLEKTQLNQYIKELKEFPKTFSYQKLVEEIEISFADSLLKPNVFIPSHWGRSTKINKPHKIKLCWQEENDEKFERIRVFPIQVEKDGTILTNVQMRLGFPPALAISIQKNIIKFCQKTVFSRP